MTKVFFSDTDEIVDLSNDAVFKAAFTQNTPGSRESLRRLLIAILKRELTITSITINANEPPIQDTRERQIRYDISVTFNDGELANVEMTLWPTAHEVRRLEYYVDRLFLNQDIKGKDKSFRHLRRAYQISFIAKRRLFDDDELVHHFEYHDREHNMPLGGQTQIITLELVKLDRVLQKAAANMSAEERWSAFVRFCGDKSKRGLINELLALEEGIALVAQTMQGFTQEQLEYFHAMSREKFELDMQSIATDARDEGRELGRKESRQVIAEKDRAIGEKDRAIDEKDRAIGEKDRAIGEKDRTIDEKDRAIAEKDRENAELRQKLRVAGLE
ncbi:hypothetical protein AGMMS4952_09100 [Spirochaetia bacterium]|nr:hypothetical protein AGMMS4952_09100 [Spirochaetia bacterium]